MFRPQEIISSESDPLCRGELSLLLLNRIEAADPVDGRPPGEVDHVDGVVAELRDDQPLAAEIDRHVIDAPGHAIEGNGRIERQRRLSFGGMARCAQCEAQRDQNDCEILHLHLNYEAQRPVARSPKARGCERTHAPIVAERAIFDSSPLERPYAQVSELYARAKVMILQSDVALW
jgi:hypothetical protein